MFNDGGTIDHTSYWLLEQQVSIYGMPATIGIGIACTTKLKKFKDPIQTR